MTRKVLSAGVFLACAVGLLGAEPSRRRRPGLPRLHHRDRPRRRQSPGESVHLVGSGFQPGFTTEIFIDGISVGHGHHRRRRASSRPIVEVPEGAGPGTVTVTAACDGTGDNVASTELTIPGDTAPTLTLSTTVVERGEQVVATVTGAQPGVTVEFSRWRGNTGFRHYRCPGQRQHHVHHSPPTPPSAPTRSRRPSVDAEGNPVVLTATIQVVADSAADGGGTDGAAGGGDLPTDR